MIHTPYDGSSKPFSINLRRLDLQEWTEVTPKLADYLDEKRRLYREVPQDVLVAEDGTEEAQAEVLSLLVAHVQQRFPETYRLSGSSMEILGGLHHVALNDPTLSPIARAALMLQEDLVLMRRSDAGWRLVAASLCFPSAWTLAEKFGKPLHQIHDPVPGFGEGTRNASLIDRMFDNLKAEQPVLRWNWSIYADNRLHLPASNNSAVRRFGEGDIRGKVTLRLERQTLRRLPASGDILFTIGIHLDPLEVLEGIAEGPQLARAIDQQLWALTDDEIRYKSFENERQRLSDRLQQIAGLEAQG